MTRSHILCTLALAGGFLSFASTAEAKNCGTLDLRHLGDFKYQEIQASPDLTCRKVRKWIRTVHPKAYTCAGLSWGDTDYPSWYWVCERQDPYRGYSFVVY